MTTQDERYVVDTHAIVWYLTNDPRLTERAANAIRLGEQGQSELMIPIIVLAELLRIVEKGRTSLDMAAVVDWMGRSATIVVVPLDLAVFARLIDLGTRLELHDRIIAATATLYGAPLITRDPQLGAAVRTVW